MLFRTEMGATDARVPNLTGGVLIGCAGNADDDILPAGNADDDFADKFVTAEGNILIY